MLKNKTYIKDLSELAELPVPWHEIKNKSILITGATGLIGSFLTDVLMYRNEKYGDNIKVITLGRNEDNARKRFEKHFQNELFLFLKQDISEPIRVSCAIDFVVHGASNATPLAYFSDPTGTMITNFLGMYNLLRYARSSNVKRTLYISSGEVYGENDSKASLSEDDYGYVDITTPRSCYPSSKRATETLCASFISQYNLDIVIARPCHVYGATFTKSDNRAYAQFFRRAISNHDITLKSMGLQRRSYCYVSDAVSALFYVLFYGEKGQAYNLANKNSTTTIRQLAESIAMVSKQNVQFELSDEVEKDGCSVVSNAVIDTKKLESLGWKARFSLKDGIERTLQIASEQPAGYFDTREE